MQKHLAKPSSAAERQPQVIYCPHKLVTDQLFSQHLGAAQHQPHFMLRKPQKAVKLICDKSGRRSEGFWCPSVLARSPNLQQDKSHLIWSLRAVILFRYRCGICPRVSSHSLLFSKTKEEQRNKPMGRGGLEEKKKVEEMPTIVGSG